MSKQLIQVNEDGTTHKHLHELSRDAKAFDETWLQELLIANPGILPINEIDESWDNLIPLGREVSVASGAIDNLYVTGQGMICLVETKLWRNPGAHRTVVAQIIAYAKDLARLDINDFIQAVEKSSIKGKKPSFWERINKDAKEVDNIDFESRIIKSLQNGRFLLLIVGDRISPEVALILETIQSAPNLEFKIGLIELHLYETDPEGRWPLLVLPKIVAKTHEVTRAVVRIIFEGNKPDIEASSFAENVTKGKTDRIKFEKSFPAENGEIFSPIFDKWLSDGLHIYWGIIGCSVRLLWQGKLKSILDIYPDSIALYSERMARNSGFPLNPIPIYREEIARVPKAWSLLAEGKRYLYYKDITLEEFKIILNATDKLVRAYFEYEKNSI